MLYNVLRKEMESFMIKNIIFDLGNVLIDFDYKKYLEENFTDEETRTFLASKMFEDSKWKEFDLGLKTNNEIANMFINENPRYKDEILKVTKDFPNIIEEFSYSKKYLQLLKSKGFKIYYLSNMGLEAYNKGVITSSFYPIADGEIMSYRIHSVKPEEKIYTSLLEKYSLNPSECLFFDDNLDNVDKAKEMGFEAVRVLGEFSIENALKKYNII